MGTFIDLTNKRFDRLLVLEKAEKRSSEWYWKCRCDCGKTVIIRGSNLRRGATHSCGCWKKESDKKPKGNVIDLAGKKFNHLTVLERAGSDKRGEALWLCKCDCGNPTLIKVLGSNLRNGHTQSCGCERRSHGEIAIFNLLIQNNISFETEKSMFKYSNNRNARFDFYIENKYLIEYDGETHYPISLHGWHSEEQLNAQLERDAIKNQWCKNNHIPLIRIPYWHLKDLCIEDLLLETSTFKI